MESFTDNNSIVIFHRIVGDVVFINRLHEKSTPPNHGGSHQMKSTHAGGAFVPSTNAYSQNVMRHDIKIKLKDFTEMSLSTTGLDIPIIAGQCISVIYAKNNNSVLSYMVMIINHETKQHWSVMPTKALNDVLHIRSFPTNTIMILLFLLVVAATLISAFMLGYHVMNGIVIGLCMAGLYFLFYKVFYAIKLSNLETRLASHFNQLVSDALNISY